MRIKVDHQLRRTSQMEYVIQEPKTESGKSGMKPKTLQYIMGHADISVTLNTYTHVNFDDARDELVRVLNA